MRTRESFLALIAELEGDFRELGRLMAQNHSDRWHKSLVEKMALEIIDVRPALLVDETSKMRAIAKDIG